MNRTLKAQQISYVFVNELDLPKVAAAKAKFMNLNELKAPLG